MPSSLDENSVSTTKAQRHGGEDFNSLTFCDGLCPRVFVARLFDRPSRQPHRSIHLFWLVLLLGLSSPGLLANLQDTPKLAVLPWRGTGVTQEELSRFTKQFENDLTQQTNSAILRSDESRRNLEQADFRIADATSSNTLAEAAKILGTERVLQGTISRRGKLFNLLIRIIDASSAEAVYNKSWEYVGEFDDLLPKTNEMADEIAKEQQGITSGWRWYTIGAVAVLIGAAFYVIVKNVLTKDNTDAIDSGGGTGPPGPTNKGQFDRRQIFPIMPAN